MYVRQSTAGQVQDHQESTRLQYALVERAVALGWASSRVLVIDEDLGHSASGVDARPGFQRLVSEVGLDHVGIVLGIEMSRLARTGREWHQLLELCALSGALLAATRTGSTTPLITTIGCCWGLKGTISEAELHLIKQRMWSGRLAKARRGELVGAAADRLRAPPLGRGGAWTRMSRSRPWSAWSSSLFDRFGTVNAVLCLSGRQPHPARGAAARGARARGVAVASAQPGRGAEHAPQPGLRWYLRLRPQHARPQAAAGGAAVHRADTNRPRGLDRRPAGRLPAYISVEQYERNRQRMKGRGGIRMAVAK